jgi:hypothetical protein
MLHNSTLNLWEAHAQTTRIWLQHIQSPLLRVFTFTREWK